MPLTPLEREERLVAIADESGGLCMVAMDQRESLRTMFGEATGQVVGDDVLRDFKLAVAQVLSPHASAMLLDREFGEAAMRAVSDSCGLIEAADRLQQEPGKPVEETDFEPDFDPERAREQGVSGLKLLLLWRQDDDPAMREGMVKRFVDAAHSAGLLAILEGVVRPPRSGADWDREAALLRATRELGNLGADVYKAEVPYHGKGDAACIEDRCREMTEALPCPWVVLSQGVTVEDFPRAVEAACRGGASGFLAGRAVWSDIVGSGDYRERLRETSVPRLERLREIVRTHARPWQAAITAG